MSWNTLHLIRNYSFYIIASWFFLVFSTYCILFLSGAAAFYFILLFYHLSTTDNFMLHHPSTSCHVYCHSHWREIWSNRTFIFPYNTTHWRMRLEEEGVRALKQRVGASSLVLLVWNTKWNTNEKHGSKTVQNNDWHPSAKHKTWLCTTVGLNLIHVCILARPADPVIAQE